MSSAFTPVVAALIVTLTDEKNLLTLAEDRNVRPAVTSIFVSGVVELFFMTRLCAKDGLAMEVFESGPITDASS